MPSTLEASRAQILAYRRRISALDERLPASARSLRIAAWAGIQDSMPRAALLSIHARVAGADPMIWDHASLVQVWGPRYSVYVVAQRDMAVFTLGRLPEKGKTRERAFDTLARLDALLAGSRMRDRDAAEALRFRTLRYATLTGRLAIRWEGARAPMVWTVPEPAITPSEATRELARRFLHVFGPSVPAAFATWAGIDARAATSVFGALAGDLVPVRTPLGEAFLLARDEEELRTQGAPSTGVRFLPSGDTYTLGVTREERAFLVPDERQRNALWTPRVWPGALLVDGAVVGTWRRARRVFTIESWRALRRSVVDEAVAEAERLPLPDPGPTVVDVARIGA